MTQDEIIEMARQAGFTVGYGSPALSKHEVFAKLVAEREREECAKLCEGLDDASYPASIVFPSECAKTIRARQ